MMTSTTDHWLFSISEIDWRSAPLFLPLQQSDARGGHPHHPHHEPYPERGTIALLPDQNPNIVSSTLHTFSIPPLCAAAEVRTYNAPCAAGISTRKKRRAAKRHPAEPLPLVFARMFIALSLFFWARCSLPRRIIRTHRHLFIYTSLPSAPRHDLWSLAVALIQRCRPNAVFKHSRGWQNQFDGGLFYIISILFRFVIPVRLCLQAYLLFYAGELNDSPGTQ